MGQGHQIIVPRYIHENVVKIWLLALDIMYSHIDSDTNGIQTKNNKTTPLQGKGRT